MRMFLILFGYFFNFLDGYPHYPVAKVAKKWLPDGYFWVRSINFWIPYSQFCATMERMATSMATFYHGYLPPWLLQWLPAG